MMTAVEETVYTIEATKRTPLIYFDKSQGELKIEGKSLPEYSYAFFGDLLDEVDSYIANSKQNTLIKINLEYFNTVSSKIILQLIMKFERLLIEGKKVEVDWYYNEDDDMLFEMGEIYRSSTKIPVTLIKIQS